MRIPAFIFALSRRFAEFFLVNSVISVFISLLAIAMPRFFEREFLVTFIFSFVGVCLLYAYLIISSWHLWASVEGAWRYYLINGIAYLIYACIGCICCLALPEKVSEFFQPYCFFEFLFFKFVPALSSTWNSVLILHGIFFATICLLPFIFHFIPINDRALPRK